MARIEDIAPGTGKAILGLECKEFDEKPWVTGPALKERKLAMISTAGFMPRGGIPFRGGDHHYKSIANDIAPNDLLISHVSINFDRSGFQQDINVMFPVDRLAELKAEGVIGDIADTHYSFMGATDPQAMEEEAKELAGRLKADGVDSAILLPV